MILQEITETMKNIEKNLLNFLDQKGNSEEDYENLQKLLNDQKIKDNQYYLITIFQKMLRIQ